MPSICARHPFDIAQQNVCGQVKLDVGFRILEHLTTNVRSPKVTGCDDAMVRLICRLPGIGSSSQRAFGTSFPTTGSQAQLIAIHGDEEFYIWGDW